MFRTKFAGIFVLCLAFSLLGTGGARASTMTAFGGATDSAGDHGTIGLAGTISLSPPNVNAILTYQDSDDAADGVTCSFNGSGAIFFNGSTLGLVPNFCFQTTSGNAVSSGPFPFISFYYFTGGSIVGQSIRILDSDGDNIADQTVTGTIK